MALDPQFASAPKIGAVGISTANTGRDGTGTLGTVLTAGSAGTRVGGVFVIAGGTTTAGMVRLFLHDGAAFHFVKEVSVTALTPSATVQAFSAYLNEVTNPELFPLVLPSGWSIRASTHNAEAFRVGALGADL
jgi:hypothetical protein